MKSGMLVLIGLLAVQLGFQDAHSQSRKFGVGLLIGGSQLRGDIDKANTNLVGGATLRFFPVSNFALSVSSTYGKVTSGLNALKTRILNTSLEGTVFIFPHRKYRPFVTFGLSHFYYAAEDEASRQLHYADGSKVAGWEQALMMGVGVEISTGKNWALNAFGHYVFSNADALDGIVQGKNDVFFSGLVGLMHYFNSGKSHTAGNAFHKADRPLKVPIEEVAAEPEQKDSKRVNRSAENANGIYFEPDSDIIVEPSKEKLQKIFYYLTINQNEEIQLILLETKNQDLMLKRARRVEKYLVDLGIDPKRIIIDSVGKTLPH